MNTFTLTLDHGNARVEWPAQLTEEDLEIVDIWLAARNAKPSAAGGGNQLIPATGGGNSLVN